MKYGDRTLHILYQAGAPLTAVLNVYKTIEKKHPKNYLPVLYQADLSIRTEQKENAKTYLKKISGALF